MALALNDIIRFTTTFVQSGNEAQMVSYWQVNEINNPVQDVSMTEAFHKLQMASIRVGGYVHVGAGALRTVMDNLTRPLEFADFSELLTGYAGGDPAPPHDAILIRQTRFNKATRNGYKRIPFIGEAVMGGLTVTNPPGAKAGVEDWFGVEASLTGVYNSENVDTRLVPIIVGRTANLAGVYEIDLTRINQVVGAVVLRPTTQNSRKL